MRVLHVIPSVSMVHGGPSTALRTMEGELSERGVSVTTVSTDDDGPGRRLADTQQPKAAEGVTRLYFRKRIEFYKIAPGMAPWLLRHVSDFEVVHIHALFSYSSIVAALAARWQGVPFVVRPLGTLNRYGVTQRRPWLKRLSLALFEKRILRHAAAVHFTAQAEWDEARRLGVPMRGVVIPIGTQVSVQSGREALTSRFPQLCRTPFILFLSRLDPKKNVEGLLRAFQSISEDWPDVRLCVAGDGSPTYAASLKSLADDLGLTDRVVWAGHIDGSVKASALACAEVFVLPSYSENFGVAAAEALMAGRPCVLGHGVAIAQDVAAAGAGLAVSPDPPAIASALRQLMADPIGRARMGAQASVLARREFSVPAMGARLQSLYEGIVRR